MLPPSSFWTNFDSSDDQVQTALQSINFSSLSRIASEICGKSCAIDNTKCAYGGVNIVFEVKFNDDEIWIARIRRPDADDPLNGKDLVLESEVVTIRFIHENTTIPVPVVHGYDARFGPDNAVGRPYILMQAMPGQRVYEGCRTDIIPDQYKTRVYEQVSDYIAQLHGLPFREIGMLLLDDKAPLNVRVGPIHDQHHRLQPYGPFNNSFDFYLSRWDSLRKHREAKGENKKVDLVVSDEDMPTALRLLIDRRAENGPFYLAHPDFQLSNFLFDQNFTITALLDWSGCQTVPLESSARHPIHIVPDADKFLDTIFGHLMTRELRSQMARRRELFLKVFQKRVNDTRLTQMMLSSRSFFAARLDFDGILGFQRWLPKTEFDVFVKEEVVNSLDSQ